MLHNNATPENPINELEQLEEAGKKGDAAAYNRAGWRYENAIGTKMDLKKAVFCYEEALMKGSIAGRLNVAHCYAENNDNNAKSQFITVAQFSKCYESIDLPPSDDPDVNYARAICYEMGFKVSKDQTKFIYYLRLAASKNHARACEKLATAYKEGKYGLSRDLIAAKKYYEMAVNENYTISCLSLAGLYQSGELPGGADNKLIFELLKKAIKVKTTGPILGHLAYYYSTMGTPDHKKALEHIMQGVELNDAYCTWTLGTLYEKGYEAILEKDLNKACEFYQKAYALGHAQAKNDLIRLGKNPIEAVKKPQQSQHVEMKTVQHPAVVKTNDAVDLALLESLLRDAITRAVPKEKNHDIIADAWNQENGFGVPRDAKKARAAYEQAKQLGNTTALARLALFKTMSTMPCTMNISYNDCTFGNVLGSGAFSTVYQTKFNSTSFDDKPDIFAVKKLNKCDELSFKFFEAEVKIAKMNINSPNVIKFLGVCMSPPFIAMEKADCSLDDYMMNNNFNAMYYTIAQGIANGVACLHSYGMIHRDIKPGNILLDDNLTPKVADFDFAIHKTMYAERRSGTTDYKAPELFSGEVLLFSEKSDVYALGMTFFSMVAKKRPFNEKKDSEEFGKKIQNGMRPDIPDHCPAAFASIIRECWQTDPDRRPTAAQVAEKLSNLKRR